MYLGDVGMNSISLAGRFSASGMERYGELVWEGKEPMTFEPVQRHMGRGPAASSGCWHEDQGISVGEIEEAARSRSA